MTGSRGKALKYIDIPGDKASMSSEFEIQMRKKF